MAPLAVNVTVCPIHNILALVTAVTVGPGVTETTTLPVPVHPLPLVPVAVYTIVEAGVTTTTDPGNEPGFQVYVTAPLADKVAVPPVQTDGEPVEAITEGF